MGVKDDWIRSMGGNPARYRNLELPPLVTERPRTSSPKLVVQGAPYLVFLDDQMPSKLG